jgi:hypothetical protein
MKLVVDEWCYDGHHQPGLHDHGSHLHLLSRGLCLVRAIARSCVEVWGEVWCGF